MPSPPPNSDVANLPLSSEVAISYDRPTANGFGPTSSFCLSPASSVQLQPLTQTSEQPVDQIVRASWDRSPSPVFLAFCCIGAQLLQLSQHILHRPVPFVPNRRSRHPTLTGRNGNCRRSCSKRCQQPSFEMANNAQPVGPSYREIAAIDVSVR